MSLNRSRGPRPFRKFARHVLDGALVQEQPAPDLEVHQDIYQALSEIAHAGAGNIADVTQTQARMARAESILIVSEGDLSRAMSNYERVVGVKPGELYFFDFEAI